MNLSLNSKIWISLILIYFLWGSTYLGIRILVTEIPPFFGAGFRNLSAGFIVIAGVFLILKEKLPTADIILKSFGMGILMMTIGNGGITVAAKWVPSGYISIFPAIVPIWLVFFDFLFKKRKPSLKVILGCLIGLMGVALLVNQTQLSITGYETYFSKGILFILIATLGWSLGVYLSVNSDMNTSVYMKAGLQMIGGGLVLLLISYFQGETGISSFMNASLKVKLTFAYLLMFGSVLAFLIFNWVSSQASTTLVSTYNYVNPIVAIFLGWFLMDETVNSNIIISCIFVLTAVFLISAEKAKN